MPAPLHIRVVRRKLKNLGCECRQAGASRWLVRQLEGPVTPFYIEVTHGTRSDRDHVTTHYLRKIQLKLGISRDDWDKA